MMKKLAFYLCCLLAVFLLVMCALIFVPFPSRYEKGPLVHYRVEEGAIEIFSLVNGEVGSLLGVVRSGETFTPRNIAAPEKEVPFAMSWLQSSMTAAVRRANKFMLKQSKKSRYRDFCVCYTDDSIKRGFTKELEKTRVISNVRMNFYTDGFSISGRVGPVPVFIRGDASTGGTSDHLFLRLRWIKVGQFFLPKNILRILENVFLKSYIATGHPSIKLYRITFTDKKMTMYYRKMSSDDVDLFRKDSNDKAPEIFYPYGDEKMGL